MNTEYTIETTVAYAEVDREQRLLLPCLFQHLQEAAIRHADRHDTGARAMVTRGTSWVLNRMAVEIARYPRYEEPLRVVTWSTGIRGFKGFRDFRVFCGDELIAAASSLWLFIDLPTKTLARVPAELVATFPTGQAAPHRPDLEKLRITPPGPSALAATMSIRYSDVDGNGHVNNTAYLDFLQTALAQHGFAPHPCAIEIQFMQEIPSGVPSVSVRLEPREAGIAFGIGDAGTLHAQGVIACTCRDAMRSPRPGGGAKAP
jgi:medium-chain acyl-[acyl-carrier-protein] hydrolase